MTGDRQEAGRDPNRTPISTRGPVPRPRRLSRRALATFAGVSAIGIAAALGYALSASHHGPPAQEMVSVGLGKGSDVLANAPTDYAAAAMAKVASAPAPGAGPAASAPETLAPPPVTGGANGEASAEAQRRQQQRDSARASRLFTSDSIAARAGQGEESSAQATSGSLSASPSGSPIAGGDAQDRKAAFVAGAGAQPTVNSGRLTAPAGRYMLSAGSTIAAALITGLSSDLPGEVVAQVTEDVFDSVTGRTKLIPQGSRLIGNYDAHVTYGQSRALVVWTRIILPDGRSLDLDRMIGTDASGQSGFADRVNHHMGKLLEAGLLSTLFGVGANLATSGGDNDDIAFAIRDSAGQSIERAGDRLVQHQLDVQPTITVRPGARVRVLVGRDLLLAPWPAG
ncbi:TrbI/VirB10 family protein [Sphingomonas paucimobilis]|uniref:TrbI/VirB10 family protein n=1 Tax=Sphingomonas paucimobilis TaxID=13689 RepID=UPI000DE292D8|nr:TrbI/VirB10 family protein [Sphingomonas paucimobilis]QBE92462.1 TrbI/VirB10 family protein [Sphingomonas paucimobilis]